MDRYLAKFKQISNKIFYLEKKKIGTVFDRTMLIFYPQICLGLL